MRGAPRKISAGRRFVAALALAWTAMVPALAGAEQAADGGAQVDVVTADAGATEAAAVVAMPSPSPPPPVVGGPAVAPPVVLASPPATPAPPLGPPAAEGKPLVKRWWFWTGIGVVALALIETVLLVSGGKKPTRPGCPPGYTCD